MKKYVIMALLPIIFQGVLYSADSNAGLNKAIQSELISARRAMNNINISLDLNAVLITLLSFVEKKRMSRMVAIDQIKAIKTALEKYRSQQYAGFWFRYFGSTPEIVKNQINPALDKVENALKALNANSTNIDFVMGSVTVLGVAALLGLGSLFFSIESSRQDESDKSGLFLSEILDKKLADQQRADAIYDSIYNYNPVPVNPRIQNAERQKYNELRAILFDEALNSGIDADDNVAIEEYIRRRMAEVNKN